MAIQPGRSGRNPEVLFDHNIRSLAEGDQYLDPIYVAKEIKQKLGGKQVTEKAFFPPKNTKHRCELDTYCFTNLRYRSTNSYNFADACGPSSVGQMVDHAIFITDQMLSEGVQCMPRRSQCMPG